MSEIRIVAFADLDARTWGFGWFAEPGAPAQLAVSQGSDAQLLDATLESAEDDPWRLEGDGLSLQVTPTGATGHGGTSEELQTLDQGCTVSGQVSLPAGTVELQSPGWRSSARSLSDLDRIGSFRWAAGWLGPHHGFSLLALRPRRARGQEADLLAASVIDDPPVPRIDDPRLSTTYDEARLPVRVGLELWLEAEPTTDEDADAPPQYPRRAAGQVVSQGPELTAAGFGLHGSLMHWHSHDQEGPGVYLLGQRR